MRVLLDSHVFLWLLFAPENLGKETRTALNSVDQAWLSTVSLWELTLKHAKGRLPHPPGELTEGVAAIGISELGIQHRHLVELPRIELPHNDPFDAMLTAQAHTEGLTLMTADGHLLASRYDTWNARS